MNLTRHKSGGLRLLVTFLIAVLSTTLSTADAYGAPTTSGGAVAVFNEPKFPYFGGWCGLTPPDVAEHLRAMGIKADLLNAEQLANPAVLNTRRYFALVHLYGNPFAAVAADNLHSFHADGGSFISMGVPYCHPCVQDGADEWTFVGDSADHVERITDSPRSGAGCLRVSKNSSPGWSGAISRRIPATAGSIYHIRAWMKSSGVIDSKQQDALYIRFFDAHAKFLGQSGPDLHTNADQWQKVESDVKAPEGAVAMDVCLAFWSSPRTVLMDDVTVTSVSKSQANLIANGGFESAGGDWRDIGHDSTYYLHTHIGTGEFAYPSASAGPLLYHPDRDLLHLSGIDWSKWGKLWRDHVVSSAALNANTLPKEDEAIGIVDYTDSGHSYPVIGMIRHRCNEFHGAVDVWAGGNLFSAIVAYEPVLEREVVCRAVAAVAFETGHVSADQRARLLSIADKLSRRDVVASNLSSPSNPTVTASIFPHSPPPARELAVADVRFYTADQYRLIASLQGLVNRSKPRIYLITGAYSPGVDLDERWLQWMKERGNIDNIRRIADPFALLKEFDADYKGAVIVDPAIPATINIATMIAATQNLVIATHELAVKLKLHVVQDLRGRWKTNAAAFTWASEALWPLLNHRLLAFNAPTSPYLTDYLVEHKAVAFWISGPDDGRPPVGGPLAEQIAIEKLLAKAPPNSGCLGSPYADVFDGLSEGPGVSLLSRYAHFLSWSPQNPNLSVHSGARARSKFQQKSTPPPTIQPGKTYISLMISDGDAPVNWYGFFLKGYWDDPVHGEFPLTWSVGPTAYDLIPDLMDYYYTKSSQQDCFLCACSGAGYCYPDTFASKYVEQSKLYTAYLKLTDRYMKQLDLHGLWTHTASGARLDELARQTPAAAYLFPGYGRQLNVTPDIANTVAGDGVPVLNAVTAFDPAADDAANLKSMLADIRAFTPAVKPAFLNVFVQCYPWSPTKLKKMLAELGSDYVVVTADQLSQMYRQSKH